MSFWIFHRKFICSLVFRIERWMPVKAHSFFNYLSFTDLMKEFFLLILLKQWSPNPQAFDLYQSVGHMVPGL